MHVLHSVYTAVLAPSPARLSEFPEYHSKQTPDSYEAHVGHDRGNVTALWENVSWKINIAAWVPLTFSIQGVMKTEKI